ncbi:MAG: L-threonylcarbamoyladenylate synthase [Pseudomonadota bacterium]
MATTVFQVHPQDPQPRLIAAAVALLRRGGLLVYPTDSCYALGCRIGDKATLERIQRLKGADKNHYFSMICQDLSEIATYARVDNVSYRMLRSLTPGPYTFVLRATGEVPRRLRNPKRKTVGIRVPAHAVPQALLRTLGEPIMTTTCRLPGEDVPLNDAHEIQEKIGHLVDGIIDSGSCGIDSTTVLDLTGSVPEVIRPGKGPIPAGLES